MDPIKITPMTYYSPADSAFVFFVDGECLYHCFDETLAKQHLIDITNDLERKFKKSHPQHRAFQEKINEWTYHVMKARDGVVLEGKPRVVHVVEIKRSQKLLKCVDEEVEQK